MKSGAVGSPVALEGVICGCELCYQNSDMKAEMYANTILIFN